MATLKGFQANAIYPQPGFEPSQTENGGWEGTHTFALTRDSFNNTAVRNRFRKGVSVTTLDPDVPSFFAFMTLDRAKVKFGEGDIIWITATFAGGEGAQYGGDDGDGLSGSALPTYQMDGMLQEAPLSEHRYWPDLPDDDKIALGFMLRGEMIVDRTTFQVGTMVMDGSVLVFRPFQKSDGGPLTITSNHGKSYARRLSRGIETYLRPTFQWRERTEGDIGLTSAQINKLGEIASPRGAPPTPNGSRNWRLDSANQWSTGGKITTELVWTLSEREGWDSFIYGDGTDDETEDP